jgi:DNA primase large subunit
MYRDYEEKSKAKANDGILEINEEVSIKDFPATISHLLSLDLEDGRKRAVFLLLTFLTSIKWDIETAEDFVYDWNDKLSKPLKRNYVQAQISWFKAKNKILSPPNFNNDNYYYGLGIPKEVINKDINRFGKIKAKNPLHYVFLELKRKPKKK